MSRPAGQRLGVLVPDTDVIDVLRALIPSRTITWSEAHSMAERQASLLLKLQFIAEPPVPQFIISSLPGIVVDWRKGWPTSGMAVRSEERRVGKECRSRGWLCRY